ncbi:MAG: heavy metal translocating P-type ATPase [Balneolaceae bacterium]
MRSIFKSEALLTTICGVSLAIAFTGEISGILPYGVAVFFYVISYISGGYTGTVHTLKDLGNFEINIDFLMIAAALGAAAIGLWLEGSVLLFLFSLSESLEDFALGKSRTAIHSLMKLRPGRGLVRHPDGSEELIDVEKLETGQIVIVKPGEYIPVDGTIVTGSTTVDQSAITGESVPITREPGDSVFAATLNENGGIEVKITRPAKDTTVAKIIQLVEEAQKNRATTQRFLDKFEPAYAMSVVVAVAFLILIPWLLGREFDPVFYRAMTVLVVASPCALIISTPASIISAIANGAKNGILFKGGAHIEETVAIQTIAFDKTGTLTRGRPEVTDIITAGELTAESPHSGLSEDELLSIAAGSEQYSEHHLAAAMMEKAAQNKINPVKVKNLQAVPGQGIHADWDGKHVSVGNHKLYKDQLNHWPDSIKQKADEYIQEGKTVVFVVIDNNPAGIIALADQLRSQARQAIKDIRKLGIQKIVMLTGDNPGVAKSIAAELDIDEVHAGLLPDQKVEVIQQLKKEGRVAMVGDGVNDAPALAISHLGIAMGAAGTDVALETADVVLMGDDLSKLPYMLRLSKKARNIVMQNITFSLAVILMLLTGVFVIDLPLTAGVIGHEGSTLIVVLNGLRLLGFRI